MDGTSEVFSPNSVEVEGLVWNSGIIRAQNELRIASFTAQNSGKKSILSGSVVIVGYSGSWRGGDIEIAKDATLSISDSGDLTILAAAGSFSGFGSIAVSGSITISKPLLIFPKSLICTNGVFAINVNVTIQDATFNSASIRGRGSIFLQGNTVFSGILHLENYMHNYGNMLWNQGSGFSVATISNFGNFTTLVPINFGSDRQLKLAHCATGGFLNLATNAVVTFPSGTVLSCGLNGNGTVIVNASSSLNFLGSGYIGALYLCN